MKVQFFEKFSETNHLFSEKLGLTPFLLILVSNWLVLMNFIIL